MVEVQAQGFERVGCSGLGGSGAIAMFGDRHASGSDHQRHGGRDVERMMAIAAGAADIDRARGCGDRDHAGAHGAGGGGDFDRGFPAVAHCDQEGGDVRFGQVGIEQQVECVRGNVRIKGQRRIGQAGHDASP